MLWCFGCEACGILVPQRGVKPALPVLAAQSLNHWTTREAPKELIFMNNFKHTQERQYYNEFPSFNHHSLYINMALPNIFALLFLAYVPLSNSQSIEGLKTLGYFF